MEHIYPFLKGKSLKNQPVMASTQSQRFLNDVVFSIGAEGGWNHKQVSMFSGTFLPTYGSVLESNRRAAIKACIWGKGK
jgi:hypothetical protein